MLFCCPRFYFRCMADTQHEHVANFSCPAHVSSYIRFQAPTVCLENCTNDLKDTPKLYGLISIESCIFWQDRLQPPLPQHTMPYHTIP